MKEKCLVILVLIISLFTFTGCYYINGIDQYYFIVSLGLDSANNDLLKISVQVSSNPSGSSQDSNSSQSSNYKIYSVEARTIDEGISLLNNALNKKINLSHCSTLLISEELAKKGIRSHISTLSNNTELRHSCDVIISSSSSYDVMNNVANSGEVFSARLYDYLTNTTEYTGFTTKSPFGKFFQALDNDYYEPTAIYAQVTGATVQSAGIAVFKHDFMVGHLDAINSIAHLIITNGLNSTIITTNNPFDEAEQLDLEISLYKKTDIDIDLINGSPLISISVYPEGTIKSSGSTFNYISDENINLVEKTVNTYFENLLREYLYNISKNFNSDIIGFKGLYRSAFATKEDFNEIHWDEIFQDSFFNVSVFTEVNSSNLFNKE